MPNNVENFIYLKGDQAKINQVLEDIKSDKYGVGTIDFNKVIPMPETLNIEASTDTDKAFSIFEDFLNEYIEKVCGIIDDYKVTSTNFNYILQIAKSNDTAENYETAKNEYKNKHNISDEVFKLGQMAFANKIKYGCLTWYEWRVDNWGTKWNSYGYEYGDVPQDLADDNKIWFNTAWSAPLPIVAELSRKYPDIECAIEWADEDIGSNCGRMVFKDGEKQEEYFPETRKEAIEYACKIHGYDSPNDIGLYLNDLGNDYINLCFDEYELIEFNGKPVLFSNERLTQEDIPKGMYCYNFRSDDNGETFATVEPVVKVNFAGTIITKEPIEFGEDNCITLNYQNHPDFLGINDVTLEDFLNGANDENSEGMVQSL